jgi:PAS domain S-box-containing protein
MPDSRVSAKPSAAISVEQRWVVLSIWILVGCLAALIVRDLMKQHETVQNSANRDVEVMARLVEEHATSTIERADLALRSVSDRMTPADLQRGMAVPEMRRANINAMLVKQQSVTRGIVSMSITDADGIVYANSVGTAPGVSLSSRAYFQTVKAGSRTTPVISEAIFGRVSNKWGIQVARRLELPNGQFAGMIVANLGLEENFDSVYASLQVDKNYVISLRDDENRLIFRRPRSDDLLGKKVPAGVLGARIEAGEKEGVMNLVSTIDGVERVSSFRRSPLFPVYAVIAPAKGDMFAVWEQERNRAAWGLLGIIGSAGFLTYLLRRRQVEDLQSAKALADSEASLNEAQRIAQIGNWKLDLQSNRLVWSDEIFRIFEIDRMRFDATYEAFLLAIHPEDRDAVNAAYRHSLETRQPYGISHRLQMPDGRIKYVHEQCESFFDSDGKPICSVGTVQDITERKQNEREVQQREQYQRALLDNFPFAVWLKDTESRFLAVNQGFVNLFGQHDAEELVGKNDFDIAPAEMAERYRADDQAVLASGKKKSVEEEIIDAEGNRKWFETYKAPVFDAMGSVVGTVGFARDITERRTAVQVLEEMSKALATSRDLLQQVIDTAPIRVFWKDHDCRYLGCNPAFARDAGKVAPTDLIGLDDFAMSWAEQADLYRADDQQVMVSGQPRLNFEEPQTTPDGKLIWLRTAKVPLRDAAGAVIGVLGIYDDVTASKQAEIELDSYRNHLEELVESRTAELAATKEAAEAANRAKSTFLATMSHELRTPMTAIMGMVDLVLRKSTDPKHIDQLTKAKLAAQHLLSVINDILDISKIEAERLTLEQLHFNFSDVLDNLVTVVGQRARDKNLRLRVDIPPELGRTSFIGDPLRLGQILINFAGNAVKFTDHGEIIVHATILEDNPIESLLCWKVIDTGIGISEDNQQRVFDSFEQADGSMTRKYGGTGLGLSISKRLAKLMGGRVGVESQPGKGSTFWFTAKLKKAFHDPAAMTPVDTASAEAELKAHYSSARVLLAEDEPVNREVSLTMMADIGITADAAEDGAIALSLARQQRYDLILMDMQMPVLNGVDATRAIRMESLNVDTPILAMTANAFDEDRQVCLDAGMNDHIAKPVDPGVLYATMLKWLAKSMR